MANIVNDVQELATTSQINHNVIKQYPTIQHFYYNTVNQQYRIKSCWLTSAVHFKEL